MDKAGIRMAILDLLEESYSTTEGTPTSGQWSLTEIDRYIEEGLNSFYHDTKLFTAHTATASSPANGQVTLTSSTSELIRAEYGGYQIDLKTSDEMSGSDWRNATTTSFTSEPIRGAVYELDTTGAMSIKLYPYPTSAISVDLYYIPYATLTNATSTSIMPTVMQPALVYYGVSKAFDKVGTEQDIPMAQYYLGKYKEYAFKYHYTNYGKTSIANSPMNPMIDPLRGGAK